MICNYLDDKKQFYKTGSFYNEYFRNWQKEIVDTTSNLNCQLLIVDCGIFVPI